MLLTQTLLALCAASAAFAARPTVYLIRHGEKPSSGNGLSAQGQQRAQCLRNVFGKSSGYNIGKIIAQQYKSGMLQLTTRPQRSKQLDLAAYSKVDANGPADGSRKRPYDTVTPLAKDLGIPVDTPCDRDDPDCVANVVDTYSGSGNILLCWEHKVLTDIVTSLGDNNAPTYPSDHYDLIWTDPYSYTDITSITSEHCQGLDS